MALSPTMAEIAVPRFEHALNPITALSFLQLGTSGLYLLAGEGQFLKVFDDRKRKSICTERVFGSQAIHGIACESLPQDAGNSGAVVIWGGRSICLISIEAHLNADGAPWCKVLQNMPEVFWDDWILDGCFRTPSPTDSGSGHITIKAVLVTAHSDLLRLNLITGSAGTSDSRCLHRIASGPSSMLYSAHMLWADSGLRLLVAAGTVFGEVLLWSFPFDHPVSSGVCLHYRFTGHEGSVFGVRISDVTQTGDVKRILASCSDDRAIRIWNVSDSSNSERVKFSARRKINEPAKGFLEELNEADSTECLAVIMGHASRIWGLRFLAQTNESWDLISYGEDSTAQLWRASPVLDEKRTLSTPQDHAYQLSHQTTYSYHWGKNLWAMVVFQDARKEWNVATGGADGRITTYKPNLHGMPTQMSAWTGQYAMDEISKTLKTSYREAKPTYADRAASSTQKIFDSLEGAWKLFRNLDSAVSTYPSGTLQGIATFAKRGPTDHVYDAEYLYSESGDFITQQGLTMRANRKYVYRYSRSTDTISVWFVRPDDGSAVDYFFHKLDFRDLDPGNHAGPTIWSAGGEHLCVDDNYDARYHFHINDSNITKWHAVFNVNGPKKDYTAKATYTRDQEVNSPEEPKGTISPSMEMDRNALGNQNAHSKPDTPKTYAWISENEVLTTTEHGNILVGTLALNTERGNSDVNQNVVWDLVGHQTSLSSSCITANIPSSGIALLTGADGQINVYNQRSRKNEIMGKLPGKAGFLTAQRLTERWKNWSQSSHQGEMIGVLAACLGTSQATLFIVLLKNEASVQTTEEGAGFSVVHECQLMLQSKFIVTSFCLHDTENCIILGSRNGDITIYGLSRTTPSLAVEVTPNHFRDVHGEDAITLIQIVPCDVSKSIGRPAIITAGRDGKWAIHHVLHRIKDNESAVDLKTIHVGMPPFGPYIEGAYIHPTRKDLLLWGFRSKQFVVWNESQKMEAMATDCGGAHRNWAYVPNQDGRGGGNFAYTKASVCHIHSQIGASHQVIQQGGHGREVKAMALSPLTRISDYNGDDDDDDANHTLVATGAEDTAIRIFDLNAGLKCLSIITKHTTGIQQLRWSPDGHLLFSAAGCEELFAWRVQPAPLVSLGFVCEAQCPVVTEAMDLRIMDFAIKGMYSRDHRPDVDAAAYEPDYLLSIVYSDSSVRLFCYHNSSSFASSSTARKNNLFRLLSEGSYTTYCLTQATHLHMNEALLGGLCTAGTDGHLAFWSLPDALRSGHHHANSPENLSTTPTKPEAKGTSPPFIWTTRTAIHQNSIKALDRATLSPSEHLIATGGDDGALALTRVCIRKLHEEMAFDTTSLLIPSAHASAVTGVVFLGEDESGCGSNDQDDITNKHNNDKNDKHRNTANDYSDRKSRSITLASVSNDQRLKFWCIRINDEPPGDRAESAIQISKIANVYTSVADASALGFYRNRDGGGRGCVVVAGIGIETWVVGGGKGEELRRWVT